MKSLHLAFTQKNTEKINDFRAQKNVKLEFA